MPVRASGLSALHNCRNFTIQGGTFNVGTPTEQPRSDFRFVNLGDLILLDEIDTQNVVERRPIHRKRTGAVIRYVEDIVGKRRTYRARIFGGQDPMTAVVYDDPQFEHRMAEAQVRQRYRHPSLAQLFGFTTGLNGFIYHDESMTVSQVKAMHAGSALASHYVEYEISQHFEAARSYWDETIGGHYGHLYNLPGTAWIQVSTGKLCLDVGNGNEPCGYISSRMRGYGHYPPSGLSSVKLTENDLHAKLLCTLELDGFYTLLGGYTTIVSHSTDFSWRPRTITFPSICDWFYDQTSMICTVSHLKPSDVFTGWWCPEVFGEYWLPVKVLPTGWTRVDYPVSHDRDSYRLSIRVGLYDEESAKKWWMSQQHYVCNRLENVLPVDEYCMPLDFTTGIHFNCTLNTHLDGFTLRGTFMTDAPSDKAYLFLFQPQVQLVDGQLTITNPPDTEKYYWAFDPAGVNRLPHRTAEDIGLPTPEFSIDLSGRLRDKHTSDLIREFHVVKGFDPDSQEAAIAMGYPLVDIKDIHKFSRNLSGKRSAHFPDDKVDDDIYYSLALC